MVWSRANSQSYAAARMRDTQNRSALSNIGAISDAQCTSDCVVKSGRNSGYCASACRFDAGKQPLPAQVRARAPLTKLYGPALDYSIPYANYGAYYNGYAIPDFPRAARLMRGVASPHSSPINVTPPLNGIGLITGNSGCQQLPNGGWSCPDQ